MDYEKKYKESMAKMSTFLAKHDGFTISKDGEMYKELSEIFPELAESEDERIRKALIDGFKRYNDGVLFNGCLVKNIVAWLEKKCEQKPADETKFKVGDWVVYCNDDVDLITGIEENGYSINNSGYIPFVCASDVRLWTIQDAKDGDVLVSESNCGLGTWYCIFKSLDDDESMTVYCYLSRDGRFETKKELCFDKATYNTKPATKEQRNTLLKAMADAGYTFDFEKKELKKIEQNSAWSEEDEKILSDIIKDLVHPWNEYIPDRIEDEIKWLKNKLKSLKDRSAWKPSDAHYELEEFAKIVRGNLTGISKNVQKLFEAKYLQLTGNKMYGGFKD